MTKAVYTRWVELVAVVTAVWGSGHEGHVEKEGSVGSTGEEGERMKYWGGGERAVKWSFM